MGEQQPANSNEPAATATQPLAPAAAVVPNTDAPHDIEEGPRTSLENALSRLSRNPSNNLMRTSVNAWMRTSAGASTSAGPLARMSAAGFRAQIGNEALARMSYTPAGWKVDDTAELMEAEMERRELSAPAGVDAETIARRKGQLQKIEAGEALSKLEKVSLAEAALEEGVDVYLRRVQERLEAAGYHLPTVEVRYKELIVETDAIVGTTTLPTLINGYKDMARGLIRRLPGVKLGAGARRTIRVLKALTGVLRPATISLVLGPPSAGKTSYLQTLSGRITTYPSPRTVVNGDITYNGKTFDEFCVIKTAAYVDQREIHYAHLTVRETLSFSSKCLGQGALPKLLQEARTKEMKVLGESYDNVEDAIFLAAAEGKEDLYVELIIKLLRLSNAADTIVGDALTRGCSGGEKRRVTTGEFLVGPFHCFFLDEISNGLDAPGTYAICKALAEFAHSWKATFAISLQQPEPQTYGLFDEVVLLAEGRELYHGPRQQILDHFNALGFYLPARKEIVDFLQNLASPKDQEPLRECNPEGDIYGQYIPPRILEREWKDCQMFRDMVDYMATPIKADPVNDLALSTEKFALSTFNNVRILFERYMVLEHREWIITGYRFIQSTLMALMIGAFASAKTAVTLMDGIQLLGIIYFSLMYMILDSVPVVAITYERKRVFLKQRDNYFFPAWAFSWPLTFIELPVLAAQVIIYCAIQYFWVGFVRTAGQFFIYLLIHFFVLTFADSMYRVIGAAAPSLTVGNNIASFILLVMLVTSGFTIYRHNMPGWWLWVLWINPLAWGLRSLAINEMQGSKWFNSAPPYQALGEVFFTATGQPSGLGEYVLLEYQLQYDFIWVWLGLIFIVVIWAVMMFIPPLVFEALPEPRKQLVISDDNPFEPKSLVQIPVESDAAALKHGGASPKDKMAVGAEAPVKHTVVLKATKGAEADGSSSSEPDVSLEAVKSPTGEKEMALPFEKMALVFRNIDYYVPMPGGSRGEELQLLKKCWGAFRPGVLTALMGASGAGKTTLMDLLAGRKSVGRIEGDIFLNGHPKVQATFARVMGYVEQFDVHSPNLTVGESLKFAGAMRLERNIPMAKKQEFVHDMMEIVELTPVEGLIVGIPGETGLSHEQRKRLTIAVELCANPSVIFADEPTTGLDARAASIVARVVRNIVNSGRTVTCTIHQPSTEIFECFDQLLMMKRGGWIVYFGDIGRHSAALIRHFESFPEVPKFQAGQNPSSWALDITSGNIPGMPDFAEMFVASDLYKSNAETINELSEPPPGSKPLAFSSAYASSPITQTVWLTKKYWISYWRDTSFNGWRFIMTIAIGVVLGTLYLGKGWTNKWNYIQLIESFGVLYLGAMFLGTQNGFSVQPLVSMERTVFYRERAARTYSVPPYIIAESVVEIPYCALQALLYSSIVYFMINWLAGARSFFVFYAFNFVSVLAFTYSGMMLVHLTPNVQLASVLASGVYGFWKLWAGFIIPYNEFGNFWVWTFWINPLTYVTYGITMWQYGTLYEPIYFGGSYHPITDWLRGYYGYKHNFLWWNFAILILFCVTFRFVSYLSMAFINWQKR